jgi:hypothetical protein
MAVFSGAKENLAVVDGSLVIDGALFIDDWGDVDSIGNVDYDGGVLLQGIYSFGGTFDFGSVKRIRLRSLIELSALNIFNLFDDKIENIDTWLDIDDSDGAEVDCVVEFRQSDDPPLGSPVFTEFSRVDNTEIEARLVQARAILTTSNPAFNAAVSKLRLYADEVA